MKYYVLTDTKEQEMLMEIVNALTDDQKNLIVKFGSEMHCQGLVKGYEKGVIDTTIGVAISAGCIGLAGIGYIAWMCHKAKKSKIEVE